MIISDLPAFEWGIVASNSSDKKSENLQAVVICSFHPKPKTVCWIPQGDQDLQKVFSRPISSSWLGPITTSLFTTVNPRRLAEGEGGEIIMTLNLNDRYPVALIWSYFIIWSVLFESEGSGRSRWERAPEAEQWKPSLAWMKGEGEGHIWLGCLHLVCVRRPHSALWDVFPLTHRGKQTHCGQWLVLFSLQWKRPITRAITHNECFIKYILLSEWNAWKARHLPCSHEQPGFFLSFFFF